MHCWPQLDTVTGRAKRVSSKIPAGARTWLKPLGTSLAGWLLVLMHQHYLVDNTTDHCSLLSSEGLGTILSLIKLNNWEFGLGNNWAGHISDDNQRQY